MRHHCFRKRRNYAKRSQNRNNNTSDKTQRWIDECQCYCCPSGVSGEFCQSARCWCCPGSDKC